MMKKLQRNDLYSLEKYAEMRSEFKARVMAHKKDRAVAVGPIATLYFEDRLTIQYQIQEMLRAERIFEAAAIEEELAAYNPLVPDGANWKATFMIEVPDVDERRRVLADLIGIEDRVWMQVEGHERVYAIADEDLERETEDKTSSVHFLRFELRPGMIRELEGTATLSAGTDHDHYRHEVLLPPAVRSSLIADLD
jgi:hypothetical protein